MAAVRASFIRLTKPSILPSFAPMNEMHFKHFCFLIFLDICISLRSELSVSGSAAFQHLLPLSSSSVYLSLSALMLMNNKSQTLFIGSEVIKGILYSRPSPTN